MKIQEILRSKKKIDRIEKTGRAALMLSTFFQSKKPLVSKKTSFQF